MKTFVKHIVALLLILCCMEAFCQGRRIMQPYRRQVFQNHTLNRQPPPVIYYPAPNQQRVLPPYNHGLGIQPPRPLYNPKIEFVKENFFNRQLRLSPEQAARFWPVYRQYQQEIVAVRRAKRLNNSAAQPNGTEQINRDLAYDAQALEIKRRYNAEFLTILPPEKVSQLYKSEKEFTDEMIRQLSERNQQGSAAPSN